MSTPLLWRDCSTRPATSRSRGVVLPTWSAGAARRAASAASARTTRPTSCARSVCLLARRHPRRRSLSGDGAGQGGQGDDAAPLDPQGQAVVEADLFTWARWFEKADRKVANDASSAPAATCPRSFSVWTIHSEWAARPLLFETMVFGGPLDGEQAWYSTWEEAAAGHAELVEKIKAATA